MADKPTRLDEIDARLGEIKAELTAIEKLPDPEGDQAQRAQTLDDRAALTDTLLDEHDTLDAEAKPLREREARRSRVLTQVQDAVRSGATWGDGPRLTDAGQAGGQRDQSVHIRGGRITDPFRDMDAIRTRAISDTEMVSRARTAIEKAPDWVLDEHREQAEFIVKRASRKQKPLMAQHMLITGSEEYLEMFTKYMLSPNDNAQRAALSLTNANGRLAA